MVDDLQVQAALAPVVVRLPPAAQLVLPAGHHQEADVGPTDDLVEVGGLDISLQLDVLFFPERAVGGVGKGLDPAVGLLRRGQGGLLALNVVQGGLVAGQTDVELLRLGGLPGALLGEARLLLQPGGGVRGGLPLQQLPGLGDLGLEGGDLALDVVNAGLPPARACRRASAWPFRSRMACWAAWLVS